MFQVDCWKYFFQLKLKKKKSIHTQTTEFLACKLLSIHKYTLQIIWKDRYFCPMNVDILDAK